MVKKNWLGGLLGGKVFTPLLLYLEIRGLHSDVVTWAKEFE